MSHCRINILVNVSLSTYFQRWSLRKRKSPQRLIVSMDESQASSMGDSPSVMARSLPSERKRKAVGGQKGPSPKRKARKPTQQPETSGQQLFDIIMAGKSALQVSHPPSQPLVVSKQWTDALCVVCRQWLVSGWTAISRTQSRPWSSSCSSMCSAVVARQPSPWRCSRLRTLLMSFVH